jgi:hypothetical protein
MNFIPSQSNVLITCLLIHQPTIELLLLMKRWKLLVSCFHTFSLYSSFLGAT